MKVQIMLINGDFEIHKHGCKDVDRILARRLTDHTDWVEDHDSKQSVIESAWEDIIDERIDGLKYEAEKRGDQFGPAEAEQARQQEIESLQSATHFKPCTKRLPARLAGTGDRDSDLVSECVRCGFQFSRPQRRQTCQSGNACQQRQDAKAQA